MSTVKQRYQDLQSQMESVGKASPLSNNTPTLIAVSKRQPNDRIEDALLLGHRDFGENQVQEAIIRWQERKPQYLDLRLHLIGPLQSNKAKEAVALFDVIHTIDREKIARAIKKECDAQHKSIPCLIQINTGEEAQKSGILPEQADDFIQLCRDEIGLPICGLMCIPPANEHPGPHFALLHEIAKRHELPELSMGMSSDFEEAIRFGATYIRVGTKIFGARSS